MSAVLLNKQQVAERIGVHPESLMRMAREGRFPAPVRFEPTLHARPRWSSAVVDAWIAALCKEQRA